MVGLVIVSHSEKIAEGVAELARGVAGPDVRIAATGGLDLPDHPLGTDANLVAEAISQVYSDDGVVVLMDLGSAVLSAEMALEQIPVERRAHIVLCEAPLVEGAIAAAVQARLGSSLDTVMAEARASLAPKSIHFAVPQTPVLSSADRNNGSGSMQRELHLIVQNRLGLHARPAARFVQAAARTQADVRVRNLTTGRGPVNAKSINAVATLGVRQGHEIQVSAVGAGADVALDAIRLLAAENFGEEEVTTGDRRPATKIEAVQVAPDSALQGLAASPAIAIGAARLFRPTLPSFTNERATNPQREWENLNAAIEKTRAQIQTTREAVARRADHYAAAIFEAHLLFLDDEALRAVRTWTFQPTVVNGQPVPVRMNVAVSFTDR